MKFKLIVTLIISLYAFCASAQKMKNNLWNLPTGSVLALKNEINIPANNGLILIGEPYGFSKFGISKLYLIVDELGTERIIPDGSKFVVSKVEDNNTVNRRSRKPSVRIYFGKTNEYFIAEYFPEQTPQINSLEKFFKVDLPKVQAYGKN